MAIEIIEGDLLKYDCDVKCVTTNGFVTSTGKAVMGRGIARALAVHNKEIPWIVGKCLKENGNHTQVILKNKKHIWVMFPVKPTIITFEQPNPVFVERHVVDHMQRAYLSRTANQQRTIPGFYCRAELPIIQRSLEELLMLKHQYGWKDIVLPIPGVGAGELDVDEVLKVVNKVWHTGGLRLIRLPKPKQTEKGK
jgi:hypothetical protein